MFQTWVEWQEAAGNDSVIKDLNQKKKEIKTTILIHKYYLAQQENVVAAIRANIYDAVKEYESLDLECAMLDGRFRVVEMPKPKPKKAKKEPGKKTILDVFRSYTPEQRQAFVDELMEMEE